MTIYRPIKNAYASTAFQGSRGRGRWHRQGIPMIYAADAPATGLLGALVRVSGADVLRMSYVVCKVGLDPERHLLRLPPNELPSDWRAWLWPTSTQMIGSFWHTSRASVVLQVPSAVVPDQDIFLINGSHSRFSELEISSPTDFPVDVRLGAVTD